MNFREIMTKGCFTTQVAPLFSCVYVHCTMRQHTEITHRNVTALHPYIRNEVAPKSEF